MPFTLLHTADLHLGKSFADLPPERAEQRRADLLATLTRLCRKARDLRVNLLCIAGDLFDRAQPATPLLAATRQALAEAEVPVLLIPGNHDPLEEKSPYLESRWPGNVQLVAQAGWQRVPVEDIEVHAFGYAKGSAHCSPWNDFHGCGKEALLVLHAACLSPGLAMDAGYFPFPPSEIPICAYLALGHHHRPAQVSQAPLAWYAGSPEPLEPEVTLATACLVRLEGESASMQPIDVATRRHRLISLDVGGLTADSIWDRALAEAGADHLLYLKLTGMLDAAESLDISTLSAELATRCFAAQVDTSDLFLPAEIQGEGVFGVLQALGQERLAHMPADDPLRARLERAVRYAALALEGRI